MSRFDSMGSAYLGPSLLHVHGEPVVVYPAVGDPYTVFAIVDREVSEEGQMGSPNASAVLEILDDATGGIAITDLDRGTYEIEFSIERPGGTAERRKILQFEDPVGGMITLYMQ